MRPRVRLTLILALVLGATLPSTKEAAAVCTPTTTGGFCVYEDGTICTRTQDPQCNNALQNVDEAVDESPTGCAILHSVTAMSCDQVLRQLGLSRTALREALVVGVVHEVVEETITDLDGNDSDGWYVAAAPTATWVHGPGGGGVPTRAGYDAWDAAPAAAERSSGGYGASPGVGGFIGYNLQLMSEQTCTEKQRSDVEGKGDLYGPAQLLKPAAGYRPAGQYKYRIWMHRESATGAEVRFAPDYRVQAVGHAVRPTHSEAVSSLRDWAPRQIDETLNGSESFTLGVQFGTPAFSVGGTWQPSSNGGQAGGEQYDSGSAHWSYWAYPEGSTTTKSSAGSTIWRIPKSQVAEWRWGCFAVFGRL